MKQYLKIIKNLFTVAGLKKRLTFLMFFSSAAYNLVALLPPLATAGIIRMITENNFSAIWQYASFYVVAYVIYFIFKRVNYYAYTKLAEFYHISLQERIFENVEANPEIIKKLPRGRLLDTFADDIRWMVDAANEGVEIVISLATLAIIFIIFLSNDLEVGLIAVLVDLLYLAILNANARREAKGYGAARRAEDKAISAFSDMVSGKKNERENLGKSFPGWKREYRKKRRAISDRDTLWAGLPFLGKIILYILLAKMVIDGRFGIDVLVLLVGYFEMTITCMNTLTTRLLNLSNYGVRLDRLKQVLDK